MTPMTTILTFSWIAILGLSLTILSDFLMPILIAAAVLTMLLMILAPKRKQ